MRLLLASAVFFGLLNHSTLCLEFLKSVKMYHEVIDIQAVEQKISSLLALLHGMLSLFVFKWLVGM